MLKGCHLLNIFLLSFISTHCHCLIPYSKSTEQRKEIANLLKENSYRPQTAIVAQRQRFGETPYKPGTPKHNALIPEKHEPGCLPGVLSGIVLCLFVCSRKND